MLRTVLMVFGLVSTSMATSCEEARLNCLFRTGCQKALQVYLSECSTVLHEVPPNVCPTVCQHALIALTSSDEGKVLMNCECSDDTCRETKERVEVCRPQVMSAVHNDSIVSCEVAQMICAADSVCLTALEYYHSYCKSMFFGRKCSGRCKNSIEILRKQEKSAKLHNCRCDGSEDYNCPQIRTNMAKLCFNNKLSDMFVPKGSSSDREKPSQPSSSGYDDVDEDRSDQRSNSISGDDDADKSNYNNNDNEIPDNIRELFVDDPNSGAQAPGTPLEVWLVLLSLACSRWMMTWRFRYR